jgi:phosphate transport system permease protein
MTTTLPVSRPKIIIRPQTGYRRRKLFNVIMLALCGLLTGLALIPLIWIISYVIYKGGQYITPSFFTQLPRPMGMPGGGVLHAIEGTLVLTVLGGLFSVPPAVLAAIYVADHPNTTLGTAVRFSTDVLSGVPSIIIGLFCYALIVKPQGHYSALAGGVALAIVMFPTVLRTTEEMIKLVPRPLREGSLALGAPEWKTSLSVILPAASNGIITGVLLGLARASGETAPLLFTALGNENYEIGRIIRGSLAQHDGIGQILNKILEQPVDSLPLTMWKYAQQPFPERINQAWAVALILMAVILSLNIIARLWVTAQASRLQKK